VAVAVSVAVEVLLDVAVVVAMTVAVAVAVGLRVAVGVATIVGAAVNVGVGENGVRVGVGRTFFVAAQTGQGSHPGDATATSAKPAINVRSA